MEEPEELIERAESYTDESGNYNYTKAAALASLATAKLLVRQNELLDEVFRLLRDVLEEMKK